MKLCSTEALTEHLGLAVDETGTDSDFLQEFPATRKRLTLGATICCDTKSMKVWTWEEENLNPPSNTITMPGAAPPSLVKLKSVKRPRIDAH